MKKWMGIVGEDVRVCGVDEKLVSNRVGGEKEHEYLTTPARDGGEEEKIDILYFIILYNIIIFSYMTNMYFLKTHHFRNIKYVLYVYWFITNSTGHCCEFVYILVDDFSTLKLIESFIYLVRYKCYIFK